MLDVDLGARVDLLERDRCDDVEVLAGLRGSRAARASATCAATERGEKVGEVERKVNKSLGHEEDDDE